MGEDVDALALCSMAGEQQNSLSLEMQVSHFSLDVGSEVVNLVERLLEQVKRTHIPSNASQCWTSVHAYGSSGLHASIEGSDIDLIVLCSPLFTASYFFEGLPSLLKGVATELVVIDTAKVPVIKFVYRGIHVDLIYASTDLSAAPSLADIETDDFLLRVSTDNRFNVNGVRTVLQIEKLVGVPLDQYRCVLRAVKQWAVRRRIYHNKFAYPNGVVLAILVARACQAGRGLQTSQLLKLFFLHMAQILSAGPADVRPIYITASLSREGRPKIDGMPLCWDPHRRNVGDDLLTVLNPAYPYVNSAHAVGRSGFTHFAVEAERASRVLRGPLPFTDALAELWRPYVLTTDYSLFIAVQVACVAADVATCRRDFEAWRGYAESRLRMLLYSLEYFLDMRPFPSMLSIAEVQNPDTRRCRKSGTYYIGVRPRVSPPPSSAGSGTESVNCDQLRLVEQQVQHCMCEFRACLADQATAQSFQRNATTMLDPVHSILQWPANTLPAELVESGV